MITKQLNLLNPDRTIPTALHTEMQRSYLEYAMSVIIGRALPDVRDGLKPVHRRIIYAMHELGLTPDRPFRKCARVVGDVLGKYHPHGDQAVYDALVRMVQEFSCRNPLLQGHGNFGSIDDDPPAAMRYTETRLAPIAVDALLSGISEDIVDFTPNFDNSQEEPLVLPAQLPILLLNGCSGIAVGMATNIPPHNINEIIDGLIALIDHPDLLDEELWKIIPCPDFPTGGEIVDTNGVREAYRTGKGIIQIRGIARIEEINRTTKSKKIQTRLAIIITELPFQVNKAGWIEKLAELVNNGKIEGIADLRDESDRTGMRIVIELKRDVSPQDVIDQLYKQTPLATNFGVILLAIVNGQPQQLTLKQILQEFLQFRELTLTRQLSDQLSKTISKHEVVQGLLTALSRLDRVIEILRSSRDGSSAKQLLVSELAITSTQADAILAMPLRRLTGLEQENLQRESDELSQKIAQLRLLLSDREQFLKSLKKELRQLKKKYGDPRRTKIINLEPTEVGKIKPKTTTPNPIEAIIEEVETEVFLEFNGVKEVKRYQQPPKTKSNQVPKSIDKLIVQTQTISSGSELILITNSGKAYPLKVKDIPPTQTKLMQLLPSSANKNDQLISYFSLPSDPELYDLILLTQQAKIKRLPLSELSNLTTRGLSLIKLKEDDQVKFVITTKLKPQPDLVIATKGGRLLRFPFDEQQIPPQGRTSQGVQAIMLGNDQIVGLASAILNDHLLIVTEQGYIQQLPLTDIKKISRASMGTQLSFKSKTDNLLTMLVMSSHVNWVTLTNQGRFFPLTNDCIPLGQRNKIGKKLENLHLNETLIQVISIS